MRLNATGTTIIHMACTDVDIYDYKIMLTKRNDLYKKNAKVSSIKVRRTNGKLFGKLGGNSFEKCQCWNDRTEYNELYVTVSANQQTFGDIPNTHHSADQPSQCI